MPLYQFELVGPDSVTPFDGGLLANQNEAEDVAIRLAGDIRTTSPELITGGYQVVVKDEQGNEISRIPIDPV
jgi:uncharacterized protein DUF6894